MGNEAAFRADQSGQSPDDAARLPPTPFERYLRETGQLVAGEIARIIKGGRRGEETPLLYDLMLDYPLRSAKSLRPALCMATCRALGGGEAAVLPSAAVLELFHNAFLVHDDVEDESLLRRGRPTLHEAHGVPIAINVGDGMLALCFQPLVDNTRSIGLGRALAVLEIVARLARETVEGQALELEWIRGGRWDLGDRDYLAMVHKKTGWYTFLAPVLVGARIAGASPAVRSTLRRMATFLGLAFQIKDDLLNLEIEGGERSGYGKEAAGDLAEGKRTLILLHAMRVASLDERRAAEAILARARRDKSDADVAALMALVRRHRSLDYARAVADRYALRARALLDRAAPALAPSVHRDFLFALVDYVVDRDR